MQSLQMPRLAWPSIPPAQGRVRRTPCERLAGEPFALAAPQPERPAAAVHSSYCLTDLNGWNAAAEPFRQDRQPAGGPQRSSSSRSPSLRRATPRTRQRHSSRNRSSPHRQGPEQSCVKCRTQRGEPLAQARTALRERTSRGPRNPSSQLLRYMPIGRSACRATMERSRAGKNTASASTFTVQSWRWYLPSPTSLAQTARKMSVLRAVLNSPPRAHLRSLCTTSLTTPGATKTALLL
mmetsp:Transcript_141106/g.393284  ORF Transcript_141106/g.393284 Transcript_141106/m.393284 type:complete len:237 (-) Transcript_141106:1900-2610(-)